MVSENWQDQKFDAAAALSAEKQRLNSAVSEESGKLDSLYMQLGKQYATDQAVNIPDKYAEQFKAIQSNQKSLTRHYTQLQLLNDYMVCPKCGNKAPSGSFFCNRCGAKLPELDTSLFSTCKSCGKTVWDDMGRCVFCGASLKEGPQPSFPKYGRLLSEDTAVRAVHVAPPAARIPVSTQEDTKICPDCGTVLPIDLLYCTECGRKL